MADVCPAHSGMEEKIKNIDEKCDTILQTVKDAVDGLWKRVNQHLDESPEYRSKQIALETDQKLLRKEIEDHSKETTIKFNELKKDQERKEDKAQAKFLLAVTVIVAAVQIIIKILWH